MTIELDKLMQSFTNALELEQLSELMNEVL